MTEQKTNEVVLVEGKLRKIIHQQGQGQQPKKGQEVFALYKGTLQDGTQFDSNQDRDSPFKFTLGQGMVIKGWDTGFASMKRGEKATLICSPDYAYGARGSPPKIPANATLHFEVELLDFKDKKKEKWDMTAQEKVVQAQKAKVKGNQHLKNDNLANAIKAYQQGIEFVDFQDQPQAKKILKLLQLNISQAYLKNKEFGKCIENASKVLKDEPSNPKALYRRGLAYAKSQEFQKAQSDFLDLLKVDPQNNQAKKEILAIADSMKKVKAKQKKVFSSMFAQSLYDDKKIQPPKPKKQQSDQQYDDHFNPRPSDGQPIQSEPLDEQTPSESKNQQQV